MQRLHSLAVQTAGGIKLEMKLFHLLQQVSTVTLPFWRDARREVSRREVRLEKHHACDKRDVSRVVPLQGKNSGCPSLQRDSLQRGRPPYIIIEEQIDFLRELQFTWQDIVNLPG